VRKVRQDRACRNLFKAIICQAGLDMRLPDTGRRKIRNRNRRVRKDAEEFFSDGRLDVFAALAGVNDKVIRASAEGRRAACM